MSDTDITPRTVIQKIAAIKALRETLDIGLKDAKDVVDAAILRFRPDEVTTWVGRTLMLVEQGYCLNCHGTFMPTEYGLVYCSATCYDEARERVRGDHDVRVAQAEVNELKDKLAAAEIRLSDAQDRRAGF